MKNILICLEQLDIGGIETFTISQINEFSKKKYKCYVLAKKGILYDKLASISNVEFIEFDFKLGNYIDYENVKFLMKKLGKIKFDFAIIHQFPCILYMLPFIFKYKIPYVAYLHSIISNTCQWFIDHYSIFKILFPIYFGNANKIVAITSDTMKENQCLFDIPKEKYLVINNCIDFSEISKYKIKNINVPFNDFLLVSRFSPEKRNSIDCAISFFKKYRDKYNKDAKLNVIGNGSIFEEYVDRYSSDDILFKGAVVDSFYEMANSDVVLGVDRCILEALALKRVALICSYSGVVSFVTPEIIEKAALCNFSGNNLKSDKYKLLFTANREDIRKITLENYDYVKKKFSINIDFFAKIGDFSSEKFINFESLFNNLNSICKDMEQLNNDCAKYFNQGQQLYALLETKDREIAQLNDKIINIEKKTFKGFLRRIYRKFFIR